MVRRRPPVERKREPTMTEGSDDVSHRADAPPRKKRARRRRCRITAYPRLAPPDRSHQRYFRGVIDHIADGVIAVDAENRVRSMNSAALDLFGYTLEEAIGLPFQRLLAPPDYRRFLLALARCVDLPENARQAVREDFTAVRKDGGVLSIKLSVRLMRSGGADNFVCLAQDVTEKRQAETALKESEERLKLAVTATRSGVWDADLRRGTCWWSPEFIAMLGYTSDEMPARIGVWEKLIHPDDREWVQALAESFIDGKAAVYRPIYRLRRKDGAWIWIEAMGHCLREADGRAHRFIGAMSDVTDRKKQEAQLLRMSTQDALTGLPNRALLLDRLNHALSLARRRGRLLGALYIDLDRFKLVNDSLGHETGDSLLTMAVERIIREALRPSDTLGRLGGDEFLIIAEELGDPQEAARVAEAVLEAVRRPFIVNGRGLFASMSIGIALDRRDVADGASLLRFADAAMQAAKSGGGGDYRFFQPEMNAEAMARLELERDLRQAVDQNQFIIHYQPKFAVDGLRLVGAEALIRWRHPERGLVPPALFIPVAEQTGLIVPIGLWVLRESMRQAAEWAARGYAPLPVAVNLSVRQLPDESACGPILAAIAAAGAQPSWLELEITETMMMDNMRVIVPALRRLRDAGVAVSVDDFGTGHSSLAYLRKLPINTLKIDRSFISDVDSDADSAAIAATIISMGKQLGLQVVAEGIETQSQLDFLRGRGCDMAQGYFLGMPTTADELERRFLRKDA